MFKKKIKNECECESINFTILGSTPIMKAICLECNKYIALSKALNRMFTKYSDIADRLEKLYERSTSENDNNS